MPRMVRGALLQATWTGDQESMIQKHEGYAHQAAKAGAGVMLFQELFYGPYFCQVQDPQYYAYTEHIPDGPTTARMCDLAKQTGMVLVVPMYEEDATSGIYYNTAAVIDADGKYLGKYRKTHIPHVKGFWEKFYFRPGNLGFPVFETAVGKVGVYICYDRHFPEGARALGLNGAEMVFIPSRPPAGASRSTSGGSSRSVTRSPTATSWGPSTGSASRPRSATTTSTARATSATRAARSSARSATPMPRSSSSGTWTSTWSSRSARPGSSTATAGPRPTPTSSSPDGSGAHSAHGPVAARAASGPHHEAVRPERTDRRFPMSTLIKGGTIVNADSTTQADVLVEGERIALIGQALDVAADRIVDATGKWVIPGGIDPHTHMELPFGGTFAKDTFETGTRAAAFGGTTTIIDFAVQPRGGTLRQGLDAWHEKADGKACVDYGFHTIVSDMRDDLLPEMDALVDEGVTTFKLFTAYPGVFLSGDDAIFKALKRTASNGGLILMHAENGPVIDVVAADLVANGTTDPIGHGLARYPVLEGEATNRVIRLAQAAGAPVYFVHMSAKDALDALRRAQAEGRPVFAETCPQYLFLGLDDLGHGFEGAKFVCSPPLRDPAGGHQEELWKGLVRGNLSLVGTDHCPFDFHGQKEMGRGDFRKIPNGLPGVEERLDLIHDGGVVGGRITPNRFVEIVSTAPARIFGLTHKGVVGVGYDADLVVYDPNRKHTLSAATHHMDVDYSCYEGRQVQGGSDVVLSRGKVVVEDGQWLGAAGDGRFVKRERSAFLR